MFDGKPEATGNVAAAAQRNQAEILEARQSLMFSPERSVRAALADRYANPDLGQITVRQDKDVVFDFGSWATRVASRKNDDGTTSLITLDPTYDAFEFVTAAHEGKRALIVSDGQHEYVCLESR